MTTHELIERLNARYTEGSGRGCLLNPDGPKAAKALSTLEAEVAELREAVRPFAELASWYGEGESDDFEVWQDYPHGLAPRGLLKLGNFRRCATLTKGEGR